MKHWTYIHNADFIVEHKFRMLTEQATIQSLSRKIYGGRRGLDFRGGNCQQICNSE